MPELADHTCKYCHQSIALKRDKWVRADFKNPIYIGPPCRFNKAGHWPIEESSSLD